MVLVKAEKHIGAEPFALLGDYIIKSNVPCITQLANLFVTSECPLIAVEPLRTSHESEPQYGIVKGGKVTDSFTA
jgi:UTP--glucose-1-phosphate uridylyltransferase